MIERLGVRLERIEAAGGLDPRVLLRLALRDNPRRAQLLVSTVLGKHIPADPRLVRGAARLLGLLVAEVLATPEPDRPPAPPPDGEQAARSGPADHRAALDPHHADLLVAAVAGDPGAATALPTPVAPTDVLVLGFAETATALGHGVAETLHADYLHSTRRRVPGHAPAATFVEAHSHAVDHLLLPADPALLAGPRPLVLVDDELSTGRTVVNTINALHAIAPRNRYVVAALVDARAATPAPGGLPAHPATLDGLPGGVRVDVVSLARVRVELPADLGARAAALRARGRLPTGPAPGPPARVHAGAAPTVHLTDLGWPVDVPVGGRHGFAAAHHDGWDALMASVAPGLAVAAGLRPGERILVLGTEELTALPLRLAAALADAGHAVAFSSTTRSPAVVVDEPDYALNSAITFPAPDHAGPRFAYNVVQGFDHVLVVVDPPADTPTLRTGLLAALAPCAGRTTVVVTP